MYFSDLMKWREFVDKERVNKMIEFAQTTASKKVLDIGTKYGFTIQRYGNGVGLDINKEFLRECNIEKKICGDCYQLPFKDNSFDLIFFTEILEHLKKPKDVIKELKRVCSRRIILTTPNNSTLRKIKHFLLRKPGTLSPTTHVKEYSYLEVIRMFKKEGFKVSKYTGIGFFITTKLIKIMNWLSKEFPSNSAKMLIEFEKDKNIKVGI